VATGSRLLRTNGVPDQSTALRHDARKLGRARLASDDSEGDTITSTGRPISRLTRARTSSINSSSPFQSLPLKMRRLILVESGVMNPIT
jgi:hypothetical protein